MTEDCISREEIIAMAVAAIAEEWETDTSSLRVVSFREIPRSSLEQYIADHGIQYRKYRLGESA